MSVPGFIQYQRGFLGSVAVAAASEALAGDLNNAELGADPAWFTTRQIDLSITGTADRIITGLRELHNYNEGAHPYADKLIRLKDADPLVCLRWAHLHTSSDSANRLELPNDHDLLQGPGDTVRCYYEASTAMTIIAIHRAPVPAIGLAFSGSVFSSTIGLAATGFRLAKTVNCNLTAAATLHGMEAGAGQSVFGSTTQSDAWLGHRKHKLLINTSAFPLTIPDESGTETDSSNRFRIVGGGPIILNQYATQDVEYDDAISRWRAV